MDAGGNKRVQVHDLKPGVDRFLAEVLAGLQKSQKELPSKYFYDEKGSELFERICGLDEYYVPRTEVAIMEAHIDDITELLGPRVLLIEYGSGSSSKTRILLDHMREPAAYVPIDISREQLVSAAEELASRYPGLEVLPVCADYTSDVDLPPLKLHSARKVVYFPGSTIGNFDLLPAKHFLEHIAGVCGPGGGLLIGVDLKKDPSVLHSAYNDREGLTAAFNINLLERINSELNSDFRPERFEHYAFYNARESRIEMHLVSLTDQSVRLDGVSIHFTKGESIWTESSYKFNLEEFQVLAAAAGFTVERTWTDERQWFSLQYLVTRGGAKP
ncbi:MAG: L-histidine N(alpha)-methyltransferase [Dehalococcoidia bacterium]